MSGELSITNEMVAALDKAAANGIIAQREASQFKRTLLVSTAMGELQNLLTPKIMAPIMNLQNKSLGFRTDNPNGYPVDVVRDCLIEATLKGVYPVGNEFNIIAGRLVMPELLQRDFTPYNTAAEVLAFLRDTPARRDLAAAYAEVRERLGGPDATARAAAAIAAFLRGDALPDGNA